jgi:hypothetical protein
MMFKKPEKRKKRPTRELDPHFVWWIHGFECIICKKWPVQAHHVHSRGAGGSDRTCLPMCQEHHTGEQGIHVIGNIHFQAKHNIILESEVLKFNQRYENKEKGPYQYLLIPFKA